MKKAIGIAVFLGVAGLAGAAFAEQTPPPPSGPYGAGQQQPAATAPGNKAEAQNPNWGAAPPPPPPPPYGYGYGYPYPPPAAQAQPGSKTGTTTPPAQQAWGPPLPPPAAALWRLLWPALRLWPLWL
ncbi:hypothetical protein K9U39_01315 [Rhodoblastus acidophilus]|nr:hypothetical protein [Rhodoblastus acidophilus]